MEEKKNTRSLLRREVTYSFAKDEEVNILHRLGFVEQRNRFFASLHGKRSWMGAVVAHHLGLHSPDACSVTSPSDWIHGSFNVCIPVTVSSGWTGKARASQRLMLRFPLPYRVGEDFHPGNGDEKLRCEAGTYSWFQQNAQDVPIPQLYGFALSTGETFTAMQCLPFWKRFLLNIKCRILAWFGHPIPSRYLRHQPKGRIANDGDFHGDPSEGPGVGYLLIEYIEEATGRMLSETWHEKRHDNQLRANLFRSLSRVLLSLTRDLENEKIPTGIPREYTYSTVESYVMDILRFHDNRVLHQPNAINNLNDYSAQTAALTTMRAVLPSFFDPCRRRGPFVMSLTDFNQSNIFVDENWNITNLVDLEWICSQPIEMFHIPIWLTCKAVDEIAQAEDSDEYGQVRQELVDILASEEEKLSQNDHEQQRLSTIMNQVWHDGTFWYSLALGSPTGLFAIFYKQIKPRFLKKCPEHGEFQNVVPWYWRTDFLEVAIRKMEDKKTYDIRLREAFEMDPGTSNQTNT